MDKFRVGANDAPGAKSQFPAQNAALPRPVRRSAAEEPVGIKNVQN